MKPRRALVRAHSIGSSTAPAHSPPTPTPWTKRSMVRITAPHADLVVARDEAHGKRRQTGQQQGSDQCRLAPDPIAVMAEDRRTDWTRDKADRVDAERLQGSDQRVGFREVQFAKNQCGHLPIEQKIVRLDYRTDRAATTARRSCTRW
jgi:hypothetical protein